MARQWHGARKGRRPGRARARRAARGARECLSGTRYDRSALRCRRHTTVTILSWLAVRLVLIRRRGRGTMAGWTVQSWCPVTLLPRRIPSPFSKGTDWLFALGWWAHWWWATTTGRRGLGIYPSSVIIVWGGSAILTTISPRLRRRDTIVLLLIITGRSLIITHGCAMKMLKFLLTYRQKKSTHNRNRCPGITFD